MVSWLAYDIELGQGDSDEIEKTLSDAEGVIDLTNASVKCIMKSDIGTIRHEITCRIQSPATSGKIIIPFTETETSIHGLYYYEIKLTLDGTQHTFPSNENKTIYVKKSL